MMWAATHIMTVKSLLYTCDLLSYAGKAYSDCVITVNLEMHRIVAIPESIYCSNGYR